jgi:hypothetical protein
MTDERSENGETLQSDSAVVENYGAPELYTALMDDGTHWRAEHGATVERIESSLERAPRNRGRSLVPAWALKAAAAAALIGVVALATLAIVQPWRVLQPRIVTYPPPTIFSLSDQARYAKTVQESFNEGFTLTPCTRDPGATNLRGAPPQSEDVSWLFTSDNYGMLRLHWTCKSQRNHETTYALVLARDSVNGPWFIRQGAYMEPAIKGAGELAPAPSWLTLAPDNYQTLDFFKHSQNDTPAVSAELWYSPIKTLTRTYVLGHSNDAVTRPTGATSVQIQGYMGWTTASDGYVIVTVPQPDGTVAFFSGDGAVASVESLAASAIAHMNSELLPLGS